jgi:hypothetical protein
MIPFQVSFRRLIGIWCFLGLTFAGWSPAYPQYCCEVKGYILPPELRQQVIDKLHIAPIDVDTAIVAFDVSGCLFTLGRDLLVISILDDGLPLIGPDPSGGPCVGLDVDSLAAKNVKGDTIFAVEVLAARFGPEIAPTPESPAECLDSYIDGLIGDSAAEGFPGTVLGGPDSVFQASCQNPNGKVAGFTSIGRGGMLTLRFAEGIADSNLVYVTDPETGNRVGCDLFLFDSGGAGDNGSFFVSNEECLPVIEIVSKGDCCVEVIVTTYSPIKAGEFAICGPRLSVAPSVMAGPDLPPGAEIWVRSQPEGNCCPADSPSGSIIGWLDSRSAESLIPAGRNHLLEIYFDPAPDALDGGCGPIRFVQCLGDPQAPVRNIVTDKSDRDVLASTIDGILCCASSFRRGDANEDGSFSISDVTAILTCLFLDPSRCPGCFDAADANDDGEVDIGDPIYLLFWRFSGGLSPPAPFPDCGSDPTSDGLPRCIDPGSLCPSL